eukprot:symbB.v1.2.005858.t1/scaffold335.1/size242651/9
MRRSTAKSQTSEAVDRRRRNEKPASTWQSAVGVRAWTKGDESRQNDDAKRERLMQERFASPRQRRVGFGLRDLEL